MSLQMKFRIHFVKPETKPSQLLAMRKLQLILSYLYPFLLSYIPCKFSRGKKKKSLSYSYGDIY